jgi:hypothetical protein
MCSVGLSLRWQRCSTASTNSALQRSRETLAKRYPDSQPLVAARPNPAQHKLLDRYLQAWEGHDLNGFVALLKEDEPSPCHRGCYGTWGATP